VNERNSGRSSVGGEKLLDQLREVCAALLVVFVRDDQAHYAETI
jgi:hypothetical protein